MPGDSHFIVEAIAEFTVGIFITVLRLLTRWKLVGFKKWGGDEYFSIIAVLFWIIEIVPVILVGRSSATGAILETGKRGIQLTHSVKGRKYGSNTGWTDEERARFDEATIRRLETGSKLVLVGWFGYITALWALKTSMLFFYDRVTNGLFEQKIVRGCAVYCVASYVAVVLALIFHCRPFRRNWQVYPDPGRECSAGYTLYPIVLAFNVVSDIVIVGVPIPMLIRLRSSKIQKLIIGILLCSGIFIVIAAFLRCILALSSIDQINVAAIWAVRETFVAMVVVNAPALKPLFRLSTWTSKLRSNGSSNEYPLSSTSRARGSRHTQLKSVSRTGDTYTSLDSHVAIMRQTFEVEVPGKADDTVGGAGIQVMTDFEIRCEPV